MATRANFGNCWAEVVANWCGGTAPPVEEEIAWDSLLTVEELWPEYLDKALTDGVRSRLVIADIVDYGRTLRACRNLNRFGKVVERLRGADKGALAELKFAAALVEAGYLPELEPELNGKKLDAVVVENRERVYVEVISPELSQAMQTAEQGIGILA